jgi:hypothetical protein
LQRGPLCALVRFKLRVVTVYCPLDGRLVLFVGGLKQCLSTGLSHLVSGTFRFPEELRISIATNWQEPVRNAFTQICPIPALPIFFMRSLMHICASSVWSVVVILHHELPALAYNAIYSWRYRNGSSFYWSRTTTGGASGWISSVASRRRSRSFLIGHVLPPQGAGNGMVQTMVLWEPISRRRLK